MAAGRLKRVLASWNVRAADVVAMLRTRFGRSARTTAFLAMLRQSLSPGTLEAKDRAMMPAQ
jgi:hypothetical protein